MKSRTVLALLISIAGLLPAAQGSIPILAAGMDTFEVDTLALGAWDVDGDAAGTRAAVEDGSLHLFTPLRTEGGIGVTRPLTLGPNGGSVEAVLTATSVFRFGLFLMSPKGNLAIEVSDWGTGLLGPGIGSWGAIVVGPTAPVGTPVSVRMTLLPDGTVHAEMRDAAGTPIGAASAKSSVGSADVTTLRIAAWNHAWAGGSDSDYRVDSVTVLPHVG